MLRTQRVGKTTKKLKQHPPKKQNKKKHVCIKNSPWTPLIPQRSMGRRAPPARGATPPEHFFCFLFKRFEHLLGQLLGRDVPCFLKKNNFLSGLTKIAFCLRFILFFLFLKHIMHILVWLCVKTDQKATFQRTWGLFYFGD